MKGLVLDAFADITRCVLAREHILTIYINGFFYAYQSKCMRFDDATWIYNITCDMCDCWWFNDNPTNEFRLM